MGNTNRSKGKNLISFGAPGTGKSFSVKKIIKKIYSDNGLNEPKNNDLENLPESLAIRTTFHPDSDYSTFVGCYKPQQSEEKGKEDLIVYKYSAQAFVNAYINAWCTTKPYFLIIEEINRGNCAQIFGDIFQIIDRKPDGSAEYAITPEKDLQKYICDTFKKELGKMEPQDVIELNIEAAIQNGTKMYLPQNLTILATMNTSDQSLFPMDSAFKRRWEWKYTPITPGKKARKIKIDDDTEYSWWDFIQKVNERIYQVTQSEDKQLGYWFVKVENNEPINADTFVSKVVFYLWCDVFKDYGKATGTPFAISKVSSENNTEKDSLTYQSFFDVNGEVNLDTLKKFLGEEGLKVSHEVPSEDQQINDESDEESQSNAEQYILQPKEVKDLLSDYRITRDKKDPKQDYTKKSVIVEFPYIDKKSPEKANCKEVLAFIVNTIGKDILNCPIPNSIGNIKLIEKGTKDYWNAQVKSIRPKCDSAAKPLTGELEGYCLITNKERNEIVDTMYAILRLVYKKEYLFKISDAF